MLKALELAGFKSFADRTRFEFPRGVSIIVGPNGSGKSNVVDAMKWSLGSQSAKSLRGQEMVDVIFNGSATRGPLGAAEVTLTLDNSDRKLPIDTADVHVTRRVYRSGEAEYLINREPCRLRDIRELLAGTGITTEAYCIIEQGKVDMLLQSSPRERRLIFEEAAGISQFKIKKAAAARRLERVEQNLLRFSDIVDEVESRLRSVRSQAGKARKYRECAERLQHLRTQVGLADWRTLTKQLGSRETQIADLSARHDEREAALAKLESQAQMLEHQREAEVREHRELENRASQVREQIAALEAALATQAARRTDIEHEVGRFGRQLAAMSTRSGGAVDQLRDAAARLEAAEAESAAATKAHQSQHDEFVAAERDQATFRGSFEKLRTDHNDALRNASLLAQQLTSLETQARTAKVAGQQYRTQLDDIEQQRDALVAEFKLQQGHEAALQSQVAACQANTRKIEERLDALRKELARIDKHHRQIESALARVGERTVVLEELHERLEGLNSGVKEALLAARDAPDGPLGQVRGVVADLFQVDVDSAAMVDIALGEQSQFLVLASAGRLLEWLNTKPLGVTGRVGFLRLDGGRRRDDRALPDVTDQVDLGNEPGVMGRADRFVETSPDLVPLVARLLGRTWFVDRLATALRLAQTTGRGLSFVTGDGELLTADGTLVIGPRQASAGLLSRRSELRACREQAAELERQLAQQHSAHIRLDTERLDQERQLGISTAQHAELTARLAERRHQTAVARSQLDHVTTSVHRVAKELQTAAERLVVAQRELDATCERRVAAEQAASILEQQQLVAAERVAKTDEMIAVLQAATTERRIAAAKCDERVEMLRSQLEQAERDQQERDDALEDVRRRLAERKSQLDKLDATVLAARQSLAELFMLKQQQADVIAERDAANDQYRSARNEFQLQIQQARQQLTAIQSQRQKLELAASKIRHERQTLAERMHDDYGIDLAKEAAGEPASAGGHSGSAGGNSPPAPPLAPRESVEREIVDLRNQLNSLGAVNLDSLDELDALESRFGNMSQQYRDLVDAKASLEKIIQRINIDSRQLFLATLDVVRGHFRELFRRLFGGGEADILLEDAEDVLECGVDVMACPPGKETSSISLLSGGEKTLTCVALLLAVFRSKPSPFCILDEVDAALDEANIGRFIQVLREFLSFTQFVVVTHSKKTMAGADTLYGVTMEESGVSKHVSVRFEDVSEDGHILPRRSKAATSNEQPEQRRAA